MLPQTGALNGFDYLNPKRSMYGLFNSIYLHLGSLGDKCRSMLPYSEHLGTLLTWPVRKNTLITFRMTSWLVSRWFMMNSQIFIPR